MTAAGDKMREYSAAADAGTSFSGTQALLLNYLRGSSHSSQPLSPFDCGFLRRVFFLKGYLGVSLLSVLRRLTAQDESDGTEEEP